MQTGTKDYADVRNTEIIFPQTIKIDSHNENLVEIEKEARSAAREQNGDMVLVSWWNRNRNMGGPSPACVREGPDCPRQYAMSRGANVRVLVNGDEMELYYVPVSPEHQELDAEALRSIHENTSDQEYDNLQGG